MYSSLLRKPKFLQKYGYFPHFRYSVASGQGRLKGGCERGECMKPPDWPDQWRRHGWATATHLGDPTTQKAWSFSLYY